ncbi:hypothetical protein Tco_1140403, partial [Tanacetum coccineum]
MLAFIQVADPTKVKVGERERVKKEARLLDFTVVEGGSAYQGDSIAGGGQETETEIVTGIRFVADENVVTEKPKRQRKKRQAVVDASGSSHPPKKLRGDYGTSSRAAKGGKSPSVLKELLASSMLNVKVGVATVATLPVITSSVSAMTERDIGVPTDTITGLNLRTVGESERFAISLDSSHHSATNSFGPEDDSIIRYAAIPPVMTEAVVTSHAVNIPSVLEMGIKFTPPVHAFMFHDSDSTETVKANTAGPSYSAKQYLSMGSRELNSETLHQVFVPQWNVLNDSLLDDYDVSREFVDHLAPPALMRTEYCLSERNRLESEYEKQAGLVKAKDDKVKNLKAQLQLKEAEAAEV